MPASSSPELPGSAPRTRDAVPHAGRPIAPARGGEPEGSERWHEPLEPAEAPPFCDRCFGYHSWRARCPEDY